MGFLGWEGDYSILPWELLSQKSRFPHAGSGECRAWSHRRCLCPKGSALPGIPSFPAFSMPFILAVSPTLCPSRHGGKPPLLLYFGPFSHYRLTLGIYITSSMPQSPSWRCCWVPRTGWGWSSPAAALQLPCSSPAAALQHPSIRQQRAAARNPREARESRGKWDTATECPWQGGTMPLCPLWGSGTAGCPLEGHTELFWPLYKEGRCCLRSHFPTWELCGFLPNQPEEPWAVPCCVPRLCPRLGHVCVAVPA